jgi:hypothetical protein
MKPNYGPFKIGDLPKVGYEKCLNKFPNYKEDPIEDSVTFQKDVNGLIWRDPKKTTTTYWRPQYTTYTNTSGHLRD